MHRCNRCGGEIIFRHIDGQIKPIHVNGSCNAGFPFSRVKYAAPQQAKQRVGNFQKLDSYINPNAKCPVCGASVFFFQSEDGGKVFFDNAGWPWPKHPCTDQTAPQRSAHVFSCSEESSIADTEWTKNFLFFKLKYIKFGKKRIRLVLKQVNDGFIDYFRYFFVDNERTYTFSKDKLEKAGIREKDFLDAPGFLVEKSDIFLDREVVQFICVRKGKIISARMRRLH